MPRARPAHGAAASLSRSLHQGDAAGAAAQGELPLSRPALPSHGKRGRGLRVPAGTRRAGNAGPRRAGVPGARGTRRDPLGRGLWGRVGAGIAGSGQGCQGSVRAGPGMPRAAGTRRDAALRCCGERRGPADGPAAALPAVAARRGDSAWSPGEGGRPLSAQHPFHAVRLLPAILLLVHAVGRQKRVLQLRAGDPRPVPAEGERGGGRRGRRGAAGGPGSQPLLCRR